MWTRFCTGRSPDGLTGHIVDSIEEATVAHRKAIEEATEEQRALAKRGLQSGYAAKLLAPTPKSVPCPVAAAGYLVITAGSRGRWRYRKHLIQ